MTQDLIEVRLPGMALGAYRRSSEYHDELFREFALITETRREDSHGADGVPARLLALIADLTARFAGFTAAPTASLQAALDRDDEHVDLIYLVPPEVAAACEELDRMLDQSDAFCRAGDLLTLATPPDVVAFRKWFLGEFVAQVAGVEPTPWPRYGSIATG